MDRHPLFLITDDHYSPLGAVDIEGERWIGRSTSGKKLFDRKNRQGAEQATKKIGLFVSSSWYLYSPINDAGNEIESYDVVGRSGNIATAITLDKARALAKVSGCSIRPH